MTSSYEQDWSDVCTFGDMDFINQLIVLLVNMNNFIVLLVVMTNYINIKNTKEFCKKYMDYSLLDTF